MRLLFAALALVVAASGCAAKLTPAGRMVRQVPADSPIRAECEFLGVLEESATATAFAQGLENYNAENEGRFPTRVQSTEALTKVRNAVAELGGDAFIIVGSGDFDVQAEAYNCGIESPGPRFDVTTQATNPGEE